MALDQVSQTELRMRVLFDLGNQNFISLIIYPLLWMVLLLYADLVRLAPHFFWPNLAILIVNTSFRFFVHRRLRQQRAGHVRAFERALVVAVLLNAAHWSAMMVWTLRDPLLEHIRLAMLLVITGMIGGGTLAVAFNTTLRILFPTILAVPAGLLLVFSGNPEQRMWGMLCLAFLGYILMSGFRRQQDYLNAVSTTILLEQRTKELEQISFTDAVTGLRNRAYFDAHLELEWKRAHRQQYPLSLLIIDLDYFKAINDSYGHPAGDHCLAAVGGCLAKVRRRAGDILARIGGDEFAILLINADAQAADRIAAALSEEVRNLAFCGQEATLRVTTSIGVATDIPATADLTVAKAFIASADNALYQAKLHGRNQWQRAA